MVSEGEGTEGGDREGSGIKQKGLKEWSDGGLGGGANDWPAAIRYPL